MKSEIPILKSLQKSSTLTSNPLTPKSTLSTLPSSEKSSNTSSPSQSLSSSGLSSFQCSPRILKKPSFSLAIKSLNPASQSLNALRSLTQRSYMRDLECLTEYEKLEISSYETLYFLGRVVKKDFCDLEDSQGYYKAAVGDHLEYRYEIEELLGSGTFGKVFSCFDHKRNIRVAIKIIRNRSEMFESGKLEEALIDKIVNIDPNARNYIIHKLRSFTFRGYFCIVFELLSLNLYQFLHSVGFMGLSSCLVKRITIQVLLALKSVHDSGIIHCDLKPENILLKYPNKSCIKLIDFGSACYEDSKVFDYVQSRYYRAPEIVLDAGYDKSIDIWSLGCVVFELITGKVLFPAENEKELIRMLVERLGRPKEDLIARGRRSAAYYSRVLVEEPKGNKQGIEELMEGIDEEVIDFIKGCLRWDAKDRYTAAAALKHHWLKGKGRNM